MEFAEKVRKANLEGATIEQLKEIKERLLEKNKEQKTTFAPKINVIDKFTNIDELLIETIKRINVQIDEQEETNRQMQITNKILLALYIQEGSDGTYTARMPTDIDTGKILESIGGGEERTTIVISIPNFSGDNKKVFELSDSGFVIEIMFKSSTDSVDNKDFSVRVNADDNIIYQNSFDNFESRNKFEKDMTCYKDTKDNIYYLQFQNISYKNSFIVEIFESNASFEQIYIKYLEG